jgi:signal transduction histidine kinase
LNAQACNARASSVHIHLSFQQDLTLLEICDDGIGFTPEVIQTSGGLGIFGMQERAQRIGAQLEIISAPGKGTKVRVLAAESH